ncbi:MAG: hypothetical protein EPO09_15840 [Aquabacterium sp.]|uniref:DUF6262 family protein n=1 Tax=Aquabacterium sp. TaxID=1872578 RepID=UPI00120457A8|nr:DUF6262 family protein [Aquabacterium sp.]TAK91645.1 MAG: hypothetical protein EPO09_15840 [Aquabacterium sp.]
MSGKNGKQIGQGHLATLEAYLGTGAPLPVSTKDGTLNLTELANKTGIPKSSFYQNPNVKARLEVARLEQGLVRQGERQATTEGSSEEREPAIRSTGSTTVLERRVQRLEQQNAALVAEAFELRRQLKDLRLQLGREDMMIETGRRVPAPPERA